MAFEHEIKGEISHAANEAFAAAQTVTNDVKMLAHHLVASAGKGFGEAETWVASVGARAKSVVSTIEQDTLTLGKDFVAAAELVTNRTGVFAADLLMPESILPGVAKSVASSGVGKFFSDSARLLLGSEKTPALAAAASRIASRAAVDVEKTKDSVVSFFAGSVKRKGYETAEELFKDLQLPVNGKDISFVPPKKYRLPNVPRKEVLNGRKGFVDFDGNVWVKGPSRTKGESFEWDVQLSDRGKIIYKHLSIDGKHLNVSLDGKITH